jgi:tape measure domain-containing protein
MEGMEIPISGDFSGIDEAVAAIVAAVDRLGDRLVQVFTQTSSATQTASAATGKYANNLSDVAKASEHVGKSAETAGSGLLEMGEKAGGIGHAITGIVEGAKSIKHVANYIKSGGMAATFESIKKGASGVKNAVATMGARIKAVVSNPAFRKIAIGAIAATAAIGGTVIAVRTIRRGLDIVRNAGSSAFRSIIGGAKSAASSVGNLFARMGSAAGSGLASKMTSPFSQLASIIGAGGLLYLAVGQLKEAFNAAADFEQIEVSISQFTGSVEKAKSTIQDLAQFNLKTPFELPDLTNTTVTLMSAGIGDEAAQITKELGAVAKNGETLMELGDALAKGFSKGKFQTEELNKFLERGINLKPQFAQLLGVSGSALEKMIETGLSFNVVRTAIANMGKEGGQFFGMLERQSATVLGRISNLADAWNEARRTFMLPITDALKPILMDAADMIAGMVGSAKKLGESVRDAILTTYAVMKTGNFDQAYELGLEIAAMKAVDILTRGFRAITAFLATALPPITDALFSKITDIKFWEGVAALFRSAAAAIAAEVNRAMGKSRQGEDMDAVSEAEAALARIKIQGAGKANLDDVITRAMVAAGEAAKRAAQGPEPDGLRAAREQFGKFVDGVQGQVEELKKKGMVPPPNPVPAAKPTADSGSGDKGHAEIIADSMAKVGGGGFGVLISQAMVSQQQQSNRLLSKIVTNTAQQPAAAGSTFQ